MKDWEKYYLLGGLLGFILGVSLTLLVLFRVGVLTW